LKENENARHHPGVVLLEMSHGASQLRFRKIMQDKNERSKSRNDSSVELDICCFSIHTKMIRLWIPLRYQLQWSK
jgi:hypothetical protein